MKRYLFFILCISTTLFSCKKDKELLYNSQDNIYFDYATKDTLNYSFAFNLGQAQDTLWIPVIISGKRTNYARTFQVAVLPDSTTAVAPLDYEPLKSSYTMPADSGVVHIPVVIKNIDTALNSKSVLLTIRVTGG